MECVAWAMAADEHSLALPIPGWVMLSKPLPLSEPVFSLPRGENGASSPGSPSPILRLRLSAGK